MRYREPKEPFGIDDEVISEPPWADDPVVELNPHGQRAVDRLKIEGSKARQSGQYDADQMQSYTEQSQEQIQGLWQTDSEEQRPANDPQLSEDYNNQTLTMEGPDGPVIMQRDMETGAFSELSNPGREKREAKVETSKMQASQESELLKAASSLAAMTNEDGKPTHPDITDNMKEYVKNRLILAQPPDSMLPPGSPRLKARAAARKAEQAQAAKDETYYIERLHKHSKKYDLEDTEEDGPGARSRAAADLAERRRFRQSQRQEQQARQQAGQGAAGIGVSRVWTTDDGTISEPAELIGVDENGIAHMRSTDKKIPFEVPLNKLSKEDQAFIKSGGPESAKTGFAVKPENRDRAWAIKTAREMKADPARASKMTQAQRDELVERMKK